MQQAAILDDRPTADSCAADLRSRIFELADALFDSIQMQTSVKPTRRSPSTAARRSTRSTCR